MARILLIEPDALLARNLTDYLAVCSHDVSSHNDLQAAVMDADEHRPDVVITELQLAGRSGVEFLYEFRSYPDWQSVPLIIYTNLNPEQIEKYRQTLADLEVQACLRKSVVGLAELQAQISRVLAPAHAQV